jgi:cell division protein FtsB
MASLQQLNMNKSVEIEKLSKEVEKLKREKNILNEKVEEYESLLKGKTNRLR